MCFESSKLLSFMTLSFYVYDIKFLKQILKFLSKHFIENGEDKLDANDSLFISNLENVKTNTTLTI